MEKKKKSKKSSANIFQEASRRLGRKRKKNKKLTPKVEEPKVKKEKNFFEDPELNQLMNRINEIRGDISEKMGKIIETSGLSQEELDKFLSNADNFTAAQWKKIQKGREQLEGKVESVIGVEAKKEKKEKKEKREIKKRKTKTIGARKRWLSM